MGRWIVGLIVVAVAVLAVLAMWGLGAIQAVDDRIEESPPMQQRWDWADRKREELLRERRALEEGKPLHGPGDFPTRTPPDKPNE